MQAPPPPWKAESGGDLVDKDDTVTTIVNGSQRDDCLPSSQVRAGMPKDSGCAPGDVGVRFDFSAFLGQCNSAAGRVGAACVG